MENSFKRFLSLALAILMVFSNIPVSAFASEVAGCGHNEFSLTTTKAATCTEAGEMTFTCAVEGCGTSWTQAIDPSHNYVDGVCACGEADPSYIAPMNDEEDIPESSETEAPETTSHEHSYESVVTAPTCTEAGYTTYTCACEESYTADEVAALGHSYAEGVCSVCGAEEPAHEHSYEAVVTPPSCKVGFTTYTCACGDTYTADEVAATTHTLGEDGKCIGCGEKPMTSTAPKTAGLTGSGTAEEPYKIGSVADLVLFRESVNKGETTYNAPGKYVALTADIDMAGATWERGIGDGINATFDGIFDGKNFTIKNLNMAPKADSDGYLCGGLFGYTYGAAVIKNLVLENITVKSEDEGHNVGALVGFANNKNGKLNVSDVTVKNVTIEAPNAYGVGAIVGYSYRDMGTIEDCSVEEATITGYSFVGGITGYSYNGAEIKGCSVEEATITATSKGAGGIAGLVQGNTTITGNTVASTTVTAPTNSASVVGEMSAEGVVVDKNTADGLSHVGGDYATGDPVQAKIGGKYYTTLEKAVAAANDGDTVDVLAEVEDAVTVTKPVTIKTNGFTANITAGEGLETETDANGNTIVDKKSDVVKVDTYEELLTALEQDNAKIKLTANITGTATQSSGYGKAGIVVNAGDVLDGNGYKLTINGANATWDCAIAMKGGEVKNLTIAGAMRGIFMPGANGDVLIDNCVFENVIYTFNSDAGSKEYTVTIKNTELNGWTSFSNVHKAVVFDTCTFGEGSGYAYCRPYQATTFVGCEFNEGFKFDTTQTEDNTIEFEKCTYAKQPLTAANGGALFEDGKVLINDTSVDFTKYAAKIGEQSYKTLQAAVEAAVQMDAESVTIEILAGTYNEDLKLTNDAVTVGNAAKRPNITFKPAADAAVTLAGTITLGYRQQNVGATMWNGEVTFKGITFDHAESAKNSLDIQDVKGITLDGCTVTGDGEYGITSPGGNATTKALFTGCTFNTGAMQVLGQIGANLKVTGCTMNDFSFNVQGGAAPGMTIENSAFNMILTDAHVGQSFYAVRTNACPVNITSTEVNVDSTVTGTAADQEKWGIFWARKDSNAAWAVSNVEVNLTEAAAAQSELAFVKNDAGDTNGPGRITITGLTGTEGLMARTEGYAKVVEGTKTTIYKDGAVAETSDKAVAYIGETGYETLQAAIDAAKDNETIKLIWTEGNAPIAMNGSVYGKSVTITGTATVDWSKGFLFVGRGGEGNGTVIFDNANLTSASNSSSYGIHVSGREKNTADKYDGTLVIKNSTIELDYLINRNNVTVENSKLVVKNGFDIHGRPATETESGVNAIATFTATDSDITVVNENGMGLGREGNGKLDITGGSFTVSGSTFNVRQAADVVNFANTKVSVPKGIANAGTITITGGELNGTKITGAGTTNFFGKVNFYGANEVLSGVNGSDFDLIVNKGATLLISRFVLGYNRNITVYGEIEDAHAFDPTGKTPSLKFNSTSGVSVGGTGTGNLTVQDAYVELGNSSWKTAQGTYDWSFKNSYVSATSFTNTTARGSDSAVWNVTFDDSVLAAKNYIKNGVGTTYNFTNGSVGTTGSLRIDGVLNIDETSSVTTTSQQNNVVGAVDEHGGINGTVNVAGKLTIGSNAKTQLEVLGGELNVTGGTLDLGNHTLTLDAESKMTSSGNISGAITADAAATVEITGGTYTQDVSEWCEGDFVCNKNEDGTYGIIELTHLVINVGPAKTRSTVEVNVATMDEAVDYVLANPAYSVVYKIHGPVELTTGGSHGILDLGTNVTIEGVTADAKLTIVGGGVPDIKGVTFKNLTIADEGTYLPTANEFMYQNYIDCSFENCTFEEGIRVSGNTVLENCTIKQSKGNQYALWTDGGKVKMTGSTVVVSGEGYGMVKSDIATEFELTDNTFEYQNAANKEALNVKDAKINASGNNFIDCEKGILPTDKTNYAADGSTVLTDETINANNAVFSYYAQIGTKKFQSVDAAFAAAQNGNEVEILKAGTYKVPSGKNITVTGAVDGVVFDNIGAYGMNGASVTFNNVTFNYVANSMYMGLQHSGNLVYNNCTFNGQVFLYGQSETFTDCVFNNTGDNYNVWTYGAKAVEFNRCTFNSDGKSVLVYTEDANHFIDVSVKESTFKASAAVDGKAAIEIDTSLTKGANITVDAATTATGFSKNTVSGSDLWNNKKGSNTDANNDITVTVAGVEVLKPVTFVAKIGENGYTTLQDAFKAATKDCTIEILTDVTISEKWDCRDYATGGSHSQFKEAVTINGNNHTIKFTGTINDNNWNTVFRFEENAAVNNLTVDISEATGAQRVITAKKSLTVDGLTIIGSAKYGVIFGEGSSAADLAAAEIVVKNSNLTGTRRAISDNEGGKDVKSVVITGNTLNANVYVSASESITFTNNTASGEVDLRSYAAQNVLAVTAQGNTLNTAAKNFISAKTIVAQTEFAMSYAVATKAELNAALNAAQEGNTIVLTADIDYGTDQLAITKAITLDLGGKTLTTRNAYGGMSIKGNPTVKNGNIVHASNTAAIKVWNATAFEDLVIDVQGKGDANKTIGGIVLQSGSTTRVGSIKNVTIKGAALTNGIETYNCGDATEDVIGSMENVTINAVGTGMLISAPCGTATNCSITGGTNGIEIWIKGNYSASLDLVNSKVEGGVYAHDEFTSNPDAVNNGTLSLTVDSDTTGVSEEDITLSIARANKDNVEGILETIITEADAKVNDTYYATLAEAMAAAKAGDTVTIFAGTYTMPSMKAGITVIGEGNVLLEGTLTGTLENLTLKNLHIKGGSAQRWAYGKGNLVFENVTFEATSVYALHFDGITAGTTLTYKDCTIIGWAAMGGSPASCVFDGCTIKGNGTYGVIRTYFDATIENCTFDVANVNPNDVYQDGIHAVEGAKVTVDNCTNANGDMADIINVHGSSVVILDGETIKNVAKIGNAYYATLDAAFAAAQDGEEVEIVKAGTYKVPAGKNITITGAVEGVKFDMSKAVGINSSMTFNDVTFVYGNANYVGLQHAGTMVYNNCTFNGQVFLYGESETFNNCTFNQESSDAYNVWTYGAKKVEFNGCTFNSAGKSVLVYAESASISNQITVTNTTFNASTAVEGKAAIEIDTSLTAGATITIDAATKAEGFANGNVSGNSLWNNKKGSNTDATNDLTVKVGDEIVLAPVTFAAKIGETGYTTIGAAVKAAAAGDTVTVMARTYTENLTINKAITVVGQIDEAATVSEETKPGVQFTNLVTINGQLAIKANGVTVKNINVKNSGKACQINAKEVLIENCELTGSNGLYQSYTSGNVTFKDSTITGGTYGVHFDGSANGNIVIDNCVITGWTSFAKSINKVTISDTEFAEGGYNQLRFYQDAELTNVKFNPNMTVDFGTENVTATFNGCSVTDGSKLTDVIYLGDIAEMGINVKIDNEPVTVAANINDETFFLTVDDALKAAQAGDTVFIYEGNYNQNLNVNKAITVVGETTETGYQLAAIFGKLNITADGATVKGLYVYSEGDAGYIHAKDVLIEGCEIAAGGNAFYQSYTNGTVTFKNSVIAGSVYGIHFDGNEGGNIVIDGCKVQGWTSFASTINKVTISNTEFAEGNENQLRFYQNAELTNVKFNPNMTVDFGTENVTATFNGCSVTDGSSLLDVIYLPDINDMGINVTIDNEPVVIEATITKDGKTTYYSTLAEALAAAESDDTIVLDKDVTFSYGAREAYGAEDLASVTIDGDGHVLTLNQTNSDWGSIGLKNADAKLVLKNMTINKSGKGATSGTWNTHAIIFSSDLEMTDVIVNNAIAVSADATLTNVTITEANGYYGLWIEANGQNVTVTGGSITATNGGRGIKIADEYVEEPASVTLKVDGTKFTTAKKAAVLVSSTAGAEITASDVNIENVAADKVNFAWVDEDWAADYSKVTVNGAPAAQEGIENFAAAIVGEKGAVIGYFKSITEAVNDCTEAGNYTIKMLADYAEDVTILQKEGVNIVIDGDGKTFSGTMNIHGGSNYGSDKLTIQNVQFETNEKDHDFIWSDSQEAPARYAHNVTVKDCDFSATGAAKNTAVALRFRQAKNINVENCSASGLHSMMQFNSSSDIVVDNVSIVNCKNGVSFSQSDDVTVKNSYIKTNGATGYGIRGTGYTGYTLNVESCDVNAYIPVLVRNTTGDDFTLNVTGDNSMKATNKFIEGGAWAVISANDASDAEPVAPSVDFNLNVTDKGLDILDVYPGFVASIGTEMYRSLAEAVTEAEAGDTITLLTDITLDKPITVTKSLTIDGGEHTLTYTGTDRAIDVPNTANGANVTVKNLTVDAEKANRGINYNTTGKFTVENVTVTIGANVDGYAINLPGSATGANVTIKNSKLTSRIPLNIWGADAEINVVDTEITSVDNSTTYFYSAIQLNNDTYGNAAEGTVVNVTGGKITALDEKGGLSFAVTNWTETGIVNISETTVVTGNINNIVAWIGGAGFTSLQSALNSKYTGTIEILRDFAVSEAISVPADKKVTIDLNGKTITGTDNATASFGLININPGAELTINDSKGDGKITLTATNNRGWNAYSSVISNQRGKLTVNGGTIEHLGGTDMAYGIDNLTNGKGTKAETVINGGTVKSTYRAIRQFLNGTEAQNILTVNGGTIEGDNKSIWMQDANKYENRGTLTVGENAALKGDVYLTVTAGSTSWPVDVSINTDALKDNAKVLTTNVPAGYGLKETNGVIGVVTGMVAKVGENYYETLDDAFKAAKEGDEIVIVAPGTYALNTSGKDITITGEVNGVEFTNIGAKNMDGANVTFNNVTFTYADDSTYKGLQHAGNLVYNDCTFNGQVFLYGASETFNNCTFNTTDANNYNVWTYGAKAVAFNGCTFNSAGKSVLVYAEQASVMNNVTVTDCDFIASAPVDGKAAIEIDTSLTGGANITVDAATTVTGFGTGNVSGNSLWNNKKGNATEANNDITVVVNGVTVLSPATLVAEVNGVKYVSFQDAIDAVKTGDNTITLLAASDEDVTIKQAEGVNIVIDGKGNVYSGTIAIEGNSRSNGAETLVIENFKFETSEAGHYFIDSNSTESAKRYAHNVTVTGSTFTATGAAVDSAAAMRIRQGFNIVIDDVVSTDMHSLIQGYGIAGLKINAADVTGKNGISAGTSTGVEITNATINTAGYGIRADGTVKTTLAVENVTINAAQPIIVRKNSEAGYAVVLTGTNTLDGSEYDVIFTTGEDDKAYEAPTHAVNVKGAENLNVFPAHTAKIGNTYYESLKAAIDAAKNGETVTLLAASDEDVTVKQVEGVNITIDGGNNVYSGTITIHGNSRYDKDETLLIKNFKFETSEAGHYFIDSNSTASTERYAHNVTVKDSFFTATDAAVDSAAAMRIRQGFGISIENVTATDMHSLLQAYGNDGITITGVTVNGKNGIAVGTSKNVVITNATITADAYGIRADGEGAYNMTVTGSTIEAKQPIVVRKNTAAGYQLALENNTLNPIGSVYHVVFTAGDDGTYEAPAVKPVVTGAEGLNVFPVGVAKIGNTYYATLQAAIEAVKDGQTITLLADTAENVTIKQVENVDIILDGNGKTYSGTITIHGGSRSDGAETLTIQNFNFATDKAGHYFIDSNSTASAERYAHNVTVTGSTFTATGAAVDSAAAMRIRQGFDIAINDVTATGMHSLFQGYGVAGLSINGVKASDMKNGISTGTSTNVSIKDVVIEASGYGIRADGTVKTTLAVENVTINAAQPIIVRKNSEAGYAVALTGTNTLTAENGGYQVIFTTGEDDKAYEAPAHAVNVKGAENLNVFPVHTAKIGNAYYETLKAAIDAAVAGDNTITLLADSAEDVTVKQTEGVNIVIDGGNNVYSGTITIHGDSRYDKDETLVIQNFQFVTSEADHYFIDSNSTASAERYAHNVTVKDSSFAATGDAVDSAVAMRIRQGFDITVEDVETKNLHSLLQAYGNNGITINDVIVNGKNGISVGTSTGVEITKADITATGYGIRADGTAASDMTVESSNINAEMPIVVRKNTAAGYQLALDSNKLTAGNTDGYQVIFTKGEDGTYETPEVAFSISGHEGLKVFPMTLTAADVKLDGEQLIYNGTEQTQKFAAENGATFTVTGNTGKDAGTYTATITGTGDYIGSFEMKWSIAKRAATITAKDMTIVAGNEIPAIEVVQDGLAIGDTLKFGLETVEGANQTPGTYEIKVIVDPAENSNYEVKVVNGTLTVQKAVAKVGNTNYATLKAAIAAAKAGNTITFLADIDENVTVDKNLTIEGAEFKYTGKMGVNNDLNVTVQNINFVAGYVYEAGGSKGYLTVKNCDFDGVDNTIYYAVTMSGGNSVTIKDCTAKHYIYGLLYVPKSVTNVTVKDSQISECTLAINITHGSKVTLDNVKSSAVEYSIQTHNYGAKTITIRNCDLEGKHSVFFWEREDSTNKVPDTFIFEGTNLVETMDVKDCKLILNPVDGKVDDAKLITPEVEGLNITTNAAGYKVVYDTAAYKLVEKDYVAQIGDVKYETLAEAVAAAKDGDTVQVIADHQLDVTKVTEIKTATKTYKALIAANADITIDLNGKTVSAFVPDNVNFVFYGAEGADVVITDSSKDMTGQVSANGKNLYYMFNNTETMSIKSGNYTFVGLEGGAMFYSMNSGMNVYGGMFTQVTKGWMFNTDGNGKNIITVHGGTFNRYFIGGEAMGENAWGEVVLAEGLALVESEIEGYWTIADAVAKRVDAEKKTIQSYSTVEAALKDVKEGETIVLLKDNAENLTINGKVTIDVNGMDLTGEITLATETATLTSVADLKVVTNVAEHTVVYVKADADANAVGTYKVAPYVAQVGENKFTTLNDAIAAANNGDTVKVIADHQLDENDAINVNEKSEALVYINKSITINLNDYNLTAEVPEPIKFVFYCAEGAEVEITGTGSVDASGEGLYYMFNNAGKMTISDGNYTFNGITEGGMFYAINSGMSVTGGKFTQNNEGWMFNTVGNGVGNIITVSGGTFNRYFIGGAEYSENVWGEVVLAEGLILVKSQTLEGYWTIEEEAVAKRVSSDGVDVARYDRLADALAESQAGETVVLLTNVEESNVMLNKGITLDLNGYTIVADYVVAFNDNHIVDNSDSNAGRLAVDSNRFMMNAQNKQLPVNTDTGYMFVVVTQIQTALSGNKFMFLTRFEPVAHEYLLQGAVDSGVSIQARVTFTNGESQKRVLNFVYSDEMVAKVINSWNGTTYKQMFTLSLTGTDMVDNLSYEAVVVSDHDVEFAAMYQPK